MKDRIRRASLAAASALALASGSNGSEPQLDFVFGVGQMGFPYGIHAAADGKVYTAEFFHRVQVYDANGVFQSEFGSSGSGDGQFNLPSDVATEADGDIVVVDSQNHRIQVFSQAGLFKLKFGAAGSGDGQFDEPIGVAVAPSGFIYVTDTGNDRVQAFFPTGVFAFAFGSFGSSDGEFFEPRGIGVLPSGEIVVADTNNDRVQIFSHLGVYRRKFGSSGSGNGQFGYPWGVETTPNGQILVTDGSSNRVQAFTAEGAFLCKFGATGNGRGQFDSPYGITYHAASGRILIGDTGNSRGQAFFGVQPDQTIGVKPGRQRGDDRYNRSGIRQKLALVKPAGRRSRFFFVTQNDGVEPDTFDLRAPRRKRGTRLKILQLKPSRLNVTAAITRRNGYASPELAPGQRARFKALVRSRRRGTYSGKIIGISQTNRASRDAAKVRIRFR